MKIKQPCVITPRLLPGVEIGGAFVSITYTSRAGREGRQRYRWYIDLDGNEFTGDDLQSGCGGGDLEEGLSSLLSFLGAFAEAQRYPGSENRDLFPAGLADWAAQNSDEISLIQCELDESEEMCIEE